MMVQSKHQGKTIRGWTAEMGDTRQRSWVKQGGVWITKWKIIILEIQWFFNLKRQGKNLKAGVIIKILCSLFCSLCPWHLSAWQEKGAWRNSDETLLRTWVGGRTQPCWYQKAVTRHQGAGVACSASPGARLPWGHRGCGPQHYYLLSSTPALDASCHPHSWLRRWLSPSQLALWNKEKSAQVSAERHMKGICAAAEEHGAQTSAGYVERAQWRRRGWKGQ